MRLGPDIGLRNPETCPYRRRSFHEKSSGKEYACCTLLGEITGLADTELFRVSRGACEVCCKKRPPSREQINSVVASLLHALACKVRAAGGMEGCGRKRAEGLERWARENLDRVVVPVDGLRKFNDRKKPCFYLGDMTGEKPCDTCSGSVRLKTFDCHHEYHDETTMRDCQMCRDFDVHLEKGSVQNWATAITTAPREEPTLEISLRSLANAGWEDPLVFSEPGVLRPSNIPENRFVQRISTFGAWPNWFAAVVELYMMQPHADAYLICQDDVLFARELRGYLENSLWPAARLGVASLHTPSHRARVDFKGFHPDNEGWRAWGAQAYVFPNPSLRALMRHPAVINHRHRGPREGTRNIDSIIGYWSLISKLDYFVHQPSLTQHIGDSSTLWRDATTSGKRRASNFVGQETPVSAILDTITTDQ